MKYLSNFINRRLNHSLEGETIDASKLVDDMKNEVLIEESLLGYNIHWNYYKYQTKINLSEAWV